MTAPVPPAQATGVRKALGPRAAGTLVALAVIAMACALVGADRASAETRSRQGLHDARYCEIFTLKGEFPEAELTVWNTIGLNKCPAKKWDALDEKTLAAETGASLVVLNGPRHFLMDSATARTGRVRSFGGLRLRKVAAIPISGPADLTRKTYTDRTIARNNVWRWKRGRRIYQLLAPDGSVYVMQSYSQILDPSLSIRDLPELADRLELPPGWRYRVRRLRKHGLAMRARGEVTIIQDDLQNTYQRMRPRRAPDKTCFWEGPVDRTTITQPGANVAYPDEGAAYWGARFNLPPGARLILNGHYPHARYSSLNSYRDGSPSDTLADVEIEPRRGSANPFIPGARRDRRPSHRRWRVQVLDREPPASDGNRDPNTLYAAALGGVQELIYRVYVPDRGRRSRGGGGLPRPTVVLADGARLERRALCAAINDPVREFMSLTVPEPLYGSLVNTPGADFATTPAFSPPRWEAFFNFAYALSVYKLGTPSEPDRATLDTTQSGGQYSNGDARYTFVPVNRAYGEILVLQGKMPRFPAARGGEPRMTPGQVRYWSLCQNEGPVTTAVVACVYDEQVPLSKGRKFTIVVSTNATRPDDASYRCGVAWLPWGHFVDPLGRTGTGTLLMRNIRAAPSFSEAIQNVDKPGEEKRVMGPYLPRSEYMGNDEFVAPRCR